MEGVCPWAPLTSWASLIQCSNLLSSLSHSLTLTLSLSLSLSLPPSLLSSIPFFLPPTGLSDPFVELSLLPEWLFPESAKELFKTTVQKQTVDPVFNQEFKM